MFTNSATEAWVRTGGRKFYLADKALGAVTWLTVAGFALAGWKPEAAETVAKVLPAIALAFVGLISAFSGTSAYVEGKLGGGGRTIESSSSQTKVVDAPAPRPSGTMPEPEIP